MNSFTLLLSGPSQQKAALMADLASIEGVHTIQEESVRPTSDPILQRTPQGQIDIIDLVIAFGVNVAATASYDLIKAKIIHLAKSRGFKPKDSKQ